LFLSYTKIT